MEFLEPNQELTMTVAEDAEVGKLVAQNLVKYVEKFVGPSAYKELSIVLNDSTGKMVGGLHGMSNWQWLFIKSVYVNEGHRYKGIGTKLIHAAEVEARKRSCSGVWLDTFSFQSPDFYKKLGYAKFGTIHDYPFGHDRHFFFKKFV